MSAVHVRVQVRGEVYAVPVEQVLEVAELGEVTPVPGAPANVIGVRNLRGEILPVVDLASVCGLGAGEPARILVAEHAGHRVAFAVDEISDVNPLSEAEQETESDLLTGAALEAGSLVGVLDVARIFALLDRQEAA